MRVRLYYNFNNEKVMINKLEHIIVDYKNFPFDIELNKKESEESLDKIYSKYRLEALEQASICTLSDYSDFIYKKDS